MHVPSCLVCPRCRAPLTATSSRLSCASGHHYPIDEIVDVLGDPNPTTPAALVNEWPLTAWVYERLWRPFALTILSGERFPLRREAAVLCAALTNKPRTVLDVGTANGFYARTVAAAFPHAEVIAVERAAPMLHVAARHPDAVNRRITWLRADAADLPIAEHSVDTIISGGTLNECEQLDAVLTAISRVAHPQAQLFSMHLVDPNARSHQAAAPSGVRFFGSTEIPTRLATHGWSITNTTTTGRVQFVTATK